MERQEFIKKCNDILQNWVVDGFESDVSKILDSGAIDLDYVENNFKDVYPVVGAILQRVADNCVNGSAYEEERKAARKKMKNYLRFI